MKDQTIIDERPVYASDHFHLRLLEERDAEDLLQCYSDRSAVRLMNPDNCSCDVKAIPDAVERISALRTCGFNETTLPPGEIWWTWVEGKKKRVDKILPYGDYYVHERA